MKLRHLILFILACILLLISELSGGSLLALFAWLQVATLLNHGSLSKASQLWATKLFLLAIPFILFWGSAHSFLFIYLAEKSWLYLIVATVLNAVLCLIATFYFVASFATAELANYKLVASLSAAAAEIKTKKTEFFRNSALLFIFSLVPWLAADWKIVFGIMATHLYLNRNHLKPVFAAGF